MKILIVDNHDSFVCNIIGLLQRIAREEPDVCWETAACDAVPFSRLHSFDAVILSPGPGLPSEAGSLMRVVAECEGEIPLLGICLGCQAIAEHHGLRLRRLPEPRHGHASRLVVADAADPVVGSFDATRIGRYHSWVIDPEAFASGSHPLKATSHDEEGNIMSISHRSLPVYATQFHPESIITTHGLEMMRGFIRQVRVLGSAR